MGSANGNGPDYFDSLVAGWGRSSGCGSGRSGGAACRYDTYEEPTYRSSREYAMKGVSYGAPEAQKLKGKRNKRGVSC